jgi:DNA-directed RNA polymerase specialized sigma subunit
LGLERVCNVSARSARTSRKFPQVEPDRFKHKDRVILDYRKALHIEKIRNELFVQTDDRLAKQIKLYFCHKYSGLKLKEIGEYFGIGESGVSQTSLPEADKPQAF